MPTLIEIKARCTNPQQIKTILENHKADFRGIDHQIDTYFVVPEGRLKLREGNIENTLIFYRRANQAGPKQSDVHLYRPQADPALKDVLQAALGIKVVVDKKRSIYFIENVKFHVDEVEGLGSFMEIEAIDEDGSIPVATLHKQCDHWMQILDVKNEDLVERSYSDLLLELQTS